MLRLAGEERVSSGDANTGPQAPPCDILSHPAARIIRAFFESQDLSMEAERLNLIEANLADLARRAEELRGYL
jgi:hypothetical protein